MKRLIGMTAIAIALNCSVVLSAHAYTFNTTPVNTYGQPVTNTKPVNTYGQIVTNTMPVITGALPRNTTISSSINPGATSIVATTLQIHPNYTPPVPTTPLITGGLPRNTTISSSINPGASSIVATTLQIRPNYTPPVPTTPVNTFGQPVPVISSNSEFSSLNIPKISPVAIGAPTIRIPVTTTVGSSNGLAGLLDGQFAPKLGLPNPPPVGLGGLTTGWFAPTLGISNLNFGLGTWFAPDAVR
jgi:hypothetical protein